LTILDVLNISIPNFVGIAQQLAQNPINISDAAVISAVQLINSMAASILTWFPDTNFGDGLGGFGSLLTDISDAAVAAVDGVAAIADATLNDFSGLFTGLFGGLSSFLAYLPIILFVVIGAVVGCVLLQNPGLCKCGSKGGDEARYTRRETETKVGGEHAKLIRSERVHPASFR